MAEIESYPLEVRIDALAVVAGKQPKLSDKQFELLRGCARDEQPCSRCDRRPPMRFRNRISIAKQLDQFAKQLAALGHLELNRLLKPFKQANDERLGLKLVAAIEKSPAVASLRMDLLREAIGKYDAQVQDGVTKLEAKVNVDAASQRKRIEEMLPYVAKGDVWRGHAVFYSAKATCSACHRLGYAGGTIGPELSHVGETRTGTRSSGIDRLPEFKLRPQLRANVNYDTGWQND